MVSLKSFLACVFENAGRIHAYESGHDGSDGKSDCIGLIIGALALAGFKWPGIHGSNWAARNAMRTFGPIESAGEMFLGEIVYKAREPGESGYALPDRYKDSGDLRDYYHVGVVTAVDPLCITHCTSVDGGIKRDGKIGAWKWGGKLRYVDYEGGEEPMEPYWATVCANSGRTVNMRARPDFKGMVIARVPIGDDIWVTGCENDDWAKVEWGGEDGYMMRKYLTAPADRDDTDSGEIVEVPRQTLDTWADVLEEMARDIRERLGIRQ